MTELKKKHFFLDVAVCERGVATDLVFVNVFYCLFVKIEYKLLVEKF